MVLRSSISGKPVGTSFARLFDAVCSVTLLEAVLSVETRSVASPKLGFGVLWKPLDLSAFAVLNQVIFATGSTFNYYFSCFSPHHRSQNSLESQILFHP